MKIRNRDINIFSMSALDLFASAMGAFILLAVIALPFFGNISKIPTEAPLQCPEPVICPKPVPCQVCPPPTPPGFQKMDKLDLVVVLDISGSMSAEINSLKAEIRDIAALLDRLSDSAALRLVVFGDDGFDIPVTHFPLTLTRNVDILQAQLQNVKVDVGRGRGSNNTDGEAVYPGFSEAMKTQWRADATRRTVVIITDDA
ncbi:vWA domain-containing protein, partial [Arsukibacterium sp.]|uniref:vWA domain-containing protein n=1 Tax=Arsukibacterium sp. TaxID=1977258 RepID=UPI002FDA2E82